jgi:hypothetical protein
MWDPKVDTNFQSWGTLSTHRANATACVWNGRMYVVGGFHLADGGPLASAESISMEESDIISVLPPMPEKRDACKALTVE